MPVVVPVDHTRMAAALASGTLLAKLGGTPAAPTPRT